MDIDKIRENYSLLNNGVYFMNASVGGMHKDVVNKAKDWWDFSCQLGSIEDEKYFELLESSLKALSKHLEVSPDDLAFNPNTSHNMNLIALMLKQKNKKKEIIIPEDEFPSSLIPFYHHDFKILKVKSIKNEIKIEDILNKISENTSAVVVSGIQFLTGFKINLIELGTELDKRNIPFIVNGTQMLGAFKIPFKEAKIKAFSASTHKWFGAGLGMAIFMTSLDFRKNIKWPLAGWTSVEDPSLMLTEVQSMRSDTSASQTGVLSFSHIAAIKEASRVVDSYGLSNIEKRIITLSDYLESKLLKLPITINSFRKRDESKSGILNFTPNDERFKTEDIVLALHQNKIFVNQRRNSIRVSVHFYNTYEEIDLFIESLGKILLN